MRLITGGLTTILAALALASVTFAATNAKALIGTVGPGFTISMNKKTVKAGTYVITVHDLASIHDFHLTGPGVNKKTSVAGTGTTKDREVDEGDVPLRVRPTSDDHARRPQRQLTPTETSRSCRRVVGF